MLDTPGNATEIRNFATLPVVVMQRGKIVEAGPKDQLFAPPDDAYTELLLSSVPELDPDWLDKVLEQRAGVVPD